MEKATTTLRRFLGSTALVALTLSVATVLAEPVGTAFTYQGQLKRDGRPESGPCDFNFSLWKLEVGGDPVGSPVSKLNEALTNGLFAVTLNEVGEFGADAFNGNRRFLQVEVCCGTVCGELDFTKLPRQELTPAPFAMRAIAGGGGTGDGHSLDAADGVPVDAIFVNADGNVGIGTQGPSALLDIRADQDVTEYLHLSGFDDDGAGTRPVFKFLRARGSAAAPTTVEDGDTIGSIIAAAHDGNQFWNPAAIEFKVDGTPGPADMAGRIEFDTAPDGSTARKTRMVIDSDGNVGIGTTSLSDKLEVAGSGVFERVRVSPVGLAGFLTLGNATNNPSMVGVANNGNRRDIRFNDKGISLLTNSATGIPGSRNGITIDESGRVGIGTSVPDGLLHLSSLGRIELILDADTNNGGPEDQNARIVLKQDGGTVAARIGYRDALNKLEIMQEYGDSLILGTNNTDRVTITNAGNVGIGTGSASPTEKLDVAGSVRAFDEGDGDSVRIGSLASLGHGVSTDIFRPGIPPLGLPTTSRSVVAYDGTSLRLLANSTSAFPPGAIPSTSGINILNNGNVGIGTTEPDASLEVKRNSTSGTPQLKLTESEADFSRLTFANTENSRVWSIAGRTRDESVNGFPADNLNFFHSLAGNGLSIQVGASGVAWVGIGTTSPQARLDVRGRTRTDVLEITGADLAEKFPVSEEAKPGTVVAIDPHHPGQLRVARGVYNRRVAGVVSGANGLSVGVVLGNLPGHEDAPPIAMSGRVWTLCDASDSAIEPGDLLTTSTTPGHAMKATDFAKAQGAVIGKSMTTLKSGETGLVLVLVSLQ